MLKRFLTAFWRRQDRRAGFEFPEAARRTETPPSEFAEFGCFTDFSKFADSLNLGDRSRADAVRGTQKNLA